MVAKWTPRHENATFKVLGLFVSNYSFSACEEHKTPKTILIRDTVHHGSVNAIKTVIPNIAFPVIAQWCWNK